MPRHPELTASSLALPCPALLCRPPRVHNPLCRAPPFAPGDMFLTGTLDYLDKHQLHSVCLEHIRRDRILQEALATGADPLHLALVFNIDHTNAMAYANAARNLLSSPAGQALSRRPE